MGIELTITLKDLILLFIGIGVIVMIGYAISLLKNLAITAKHTNKILKDAEVITEIAAKRAQDVDKIVDDVSESVGTIADTLRGNQSTIKALTNIVNSLTSLKSLLK